MRRYTSPFVRLRQDRLMLTSVWQCTEDFDVIGVRFVRKSCRVTTGNAGNGGWSCTDWTMGVLRNTLAACTLFWLLGCFCVRVMLDSTRLPPWGECLGRCMQVDLPC